LTGGGFDFQSWEVFAQYAPEFLDTYNKVWDTHSIYYGILADHGFPGLVIFLGVLGASLGSLWQIKRAIRGRTDLHWLANYADMLQVSLIGFLTNGAFVNMEYFDLIYQWIGVIASLKILTQQAVAGSSALPMRRSAGHSAWARRAGAPPGKPADMVPVA
jgi:hypothetical protein